MASALGKKKSNRQVCEYGPGRTLRKLAAPAHSWKGEVVPPQVLRQTQRRHKGKRKQSHAGEGHDMGQKWGEIPGLLASGRTCSSETASGSLSLPSVKWE